MNATRTVAARHAAERQDIGDLITRIPLPSGRLEQIDPYLVLAHHGPQTFPAGNRGLPYGPHPHRGFETVTFIRKGSLAHGDTGGHIRVIHEGGVQWMTAGSGLIHTEEAPAEFKRDGGEIEILQMWVNLPARLKMTPPRYSGVEAAQIPVAPLADGAGELHLVSGEFAGATGPIHPLTDVFMSSIDLRAGAKVRLPAPASRNVFLYAIEGAGRVGETPFERSQLLQLNPDGDVVEIEATADTSLIFSHADPIGEPLVAQGPFVMNTAQEIQQAIRDYQAGKFGAGTELLEVGR